MRKNYFAKKLVAYSMAFAVAFSTLTVSPVFVKEAKAAGSITVSPRTTVNTTIADNTGILVSVSTNSASASTVTTKELSDAIGVTMLDVNKDLTDVSLDAVKTSDGKLPYEKLTIKEGTLPNQYKDTTNESDSTEDPKDDLIISDNSTTDFIKVVLGSEDNKGYKLVGNGTDDYNFYQLVPLEASFTRGTGAAQETITVKYLRVKQDQIEKTERVLDSITNDELGFYLGVNNNVKEFNTTGRVGHDNYKLYNVVKDSELEASAQRSIFKAKEGDACKMVVNAETNEKNVECTWKFGTKVLDEKSTTLTIDKVDSTTTGTYYCTVSDGIRSIVLPAMELQVSTAIEAPLKNDDNYIEYTSVVKCLVDSDATPGVDSISGGKVTLTSCVPQSGDYAYVWNIASTKMNENDVIGYSALNNSITITDAAKIYTNKTSKVDCYVLNKDEYNTLLASELKELAKASTDVEKYKAQEILRAKENTIAATIGDYALYKETFYLLDVKDKVISSENVVKKVGESINVTAPEVTLKANSKAVYSDTDITNTSDLLVSPATDEVGEKFAKAELYYDEFGTKRFVVVTDEDGNYTLQDTADYMAGRTYYTRSGSAPNYTYTVDNTVTKNNFSLKQSGLYAKVFSKMVAEKFVNVVYESDLKLSASDVTAKIGSTVTLSANATSSLPVEYSWDFSKMESNTVTANNKDHSKTNEFTVKPGDINKPEKDVNEDGIIQTAEQENGYVLCTAYNGIERKTVKIMITQLGGFSFVGKDNVVYKSTDKAEFKTATDAAVQFAVSALPNKNFTLVPTVKANEGTELEYAWTKGTIAGAVISTDANYTTKETSLDTPVTYYCKVTEKGADNNFVIFEYTVSKANIDSTKVKIANIPTQIYTGEAITPALTVKLSDGFVGELVEGKDYTTTFENNVNAGIARVTITLSKDLVDAQIVTAEATFAIDRADNKLEIADKTVVLGGSVQPKTTNKAGAPVTYTYYTDADCTTEIDVPSKVGTYYVKANAIATVNFNEATSNLATVKVVPGKVKMLGTSRTASSVKLNWNKTTGATSYRVFYKAAGAKSYKVFKNTTATSMNVTGLASATTYTFAVKAYAKTAGYSTVYATKQTTTAPAKVGTLTVTAGSKKATVKFDKVARATGYQVYMAKGNGSYKKVATTKSLSFTKTGLAKGATYKFKVRAYKTVGSNTYYGAFSSAKAVVVK